MGYGVPSCDLPSYSHSLFSAFVPFTDALYMNVHASIPCVLLLDPSQSYK